MHLCRVEVRIGRSISQERRESDLARETALIDNSGRRRLIELCEENDVKLVINHYRRYLDLWNRVKQLIKDREIGDLEFIVGSLEGWDQMEMGTHLLDMMRYILDGESVSWVMGQVRCTGAKRLYGHVMEEHSACYFASENGVRGFYDASRHPRK